MNTNLSRAANGFLLDLVMELKNGFIRRCDKMGLTSEEIATLKDMTIEDIHYIINSEVSVLSFQINQDNLARLMTQAREEQTRKQRIDRALALGGSIKLMEHFFGLMSNDVAARRRIAGIKVRAGRGTVLSDEQSTELWEIWATNDNKTLRSDSDEGLDLMLLAAEQMDISLTAVWNTVLRWENENLTAATRRRA
ncbi:DUF2857 domain-containing protein [Erwinia amylovora]|jgi:hypothetical protein|uniref:DUF2857 family protein n=3 Tax=Erwiniaceae TaxID=1903409 RepID=A0AAN2FIC9_ENTAG|nr:MULTISPECIES: DUF2857 domain-containing protein [Enterobacterales]AEX08400.1 DUF2857 superfamily protein [Erwinia amylovora ACW56400]AFI56271.1 hypothetical protein in PFGI-1-like cluster [Erwinia amylovora]MCE9900857.1 DUF2857 domain-containing protein [Raoultella terrigena]MCK8164539.1 DUF2857 domain-containing protein [Erwinia amylovora]MCK8184702.1 DUF2857 domain-containing protein [Erwinia amylovora]